MANLKTIEEKEKQLLKEAKKIEVAEKRVNKEEKNILRAEKKVFDLLNKNPMTAFKIDDGLSRKETAFFHSYLLKKFSKHKLVFALVVIVGNVLIWRGIWHTADQLPIISSALVSLILGIGLLWLMKKYTDLK